MAEKPKYFVRLTNGKLAQAVFQDLTAEDNTPVRGRTFAFKTLTNGYICKSVKFVDAAGNQIIYT